MANFRIKPLTEKRENENFPQQGLVNAVCREWLVHEDKALAYRLQDEEFQHHLGNNKERNALLRQDTPKAKEEQLREDEEAAKAQNAIDLAMAKQEARDASVAHAIASELDRIEIEKKRQQEVEDRLFAKALMEQEKMKVRQTKELRPKSTGEIDQDSHNNSLDEASPAGASSARHRSPAVQDLSDLSDFCLKPTSSMDEDEMRYLQEEQDEELARLLQEQDVKRRGDLMQEDQLNAIEVQDRELAKVLQEQERAKAKKAREKARQKALLKKRANQTTTEEVQTIPSQEKNSRNTSLEEESPNHYESPRYDSVSPELHQRSGSPQYASPSFNAPPRGLVHSSSSQSKTSIPHSPNDSRPSVQLSHVESPYAHAKPIRKEDSAERRRKEESHTSGFDRIPHHLRDASFEPPIPGYTNIACAIDPTYQRRVMRGELSHPQPVLSHAQPVLSHAQPVLSPSHTANQTPPVSPSSHSPSKPSYSSSPHSPLPPSSYEEEDDDDDYLPPPYMPIQGQRRLAHLDKKPGTAKTSKEKIAKDTSCRQQ